MKNKLILAAIVSVIIASIPITYAISNRIKAAQVHQINMNALKYQERMATSEARIAAKESVIQAGKVVAMTLLATVAIVGASFGYRATAVNIRLAHTPIMQASNGLMIISDGKNKILVDLMTGQRAALSSPSEVQQLRADVMSRQLLVDGIGKAEKGGEWLVSAAVGQLITKEARQ